MPGLRAKFHLLVSTGIDSWYAVHAPGKRPGDEIDQPCFGCWKELRTYDVVEVISLPRDVSNLVSEGDEGTVLMVYEDGIGNKAYEVECVLPNGTNKWLHTFERRHLR